MPNSTINANTNGINSTAGNANALDIQTGGVNAISVDASQNTTLAGSSTAPSFIPNGSSAPTNGLYLPAANTPGIASNSTKVVSVIKGSSLALEGATPQVGTGITFPAAQVSSSNVNTLDDYEEGTWTPAITGGSGTTYTTQQGRYTKVGNIVTVGFEMTLSAKGTITGYAEITGLPFASLSPNNRTGGSLPIATNLSTNYVFIALFLDANTTTISIYAKTAASNTSLPPNGSDFYGANSQLIGGITYIAST